MTELTNESQYSWFPSLRRTQQLQLLPHSSLLKAGSCRGYVKEDKLRPHVQDVNHLFETDDKEEIVAEWDPEILGHTHLANSSLLQYSNAQ